MSYRLDAYRTRMQAAFDGAEIRLDQAESLANQTQALRVEGESGDRLAKATVDGVGQLVHLSFGDIEGVEGPRLSAAVLAALDQAKRRLAYHVERLAEEVYGEDAGAASVITNSYREQFGYEEDPAR